MAADTRIDISMDITTTLITLTDITTSEIVITGSRPIITAMDTLSIAIDPPGIAINIMGMAPDMTNLKGVPSTLG